MITSEVLKSDVYYTEWIIVYLSGEFKSNLFIKSWFVFMAMALYETIISNQPID